MKKNCIVVLTKNLDNKLISYISSKLDSDFSISYTTSLSNELNFYDKESIFINLNPEMIETKKIINSGWICLEIEEVNDESINSGINQIKDIFRIRNYKKSTIKKLVDMIEEQHFIMDNCIKRLQYLTIDRYKSIYLIDDIVKELVNFYKIHFNIEENLMLILDKIDQNHIDEHTNFIQNLELNKNSVDLLIFLKKWNENHIKNRDRDLIKNIEF
jgi:hemerythrin